MRSLQIKLLCAVRFEHGNLDQDADEQQIMTR
jgi:hypothetical protein